MSPSGFRWAFTRSSTNPGSTFTVIASRSTMPMRFKYLEKSITIPAAIVCPERLVAPPLGSTATPSSAAIATARGTTLVDGPRYHNDAHRVDLVEAGVGGVEPPVPPVEVDLGAGLAGQAVLHPRPGVRSVREWLSS